jgi:hypothetical protein
MPDTGGALSTGPGRRDQLGRSSALRSTLVRTARAGLLQTRMATAPLRALPDFLIIGAQKGGTTSVYAYLSAHPHVRPGLFKEAHFFDLRFARGERWYRSIFPLRGPLRKARAITGEASPYYLFHPLAAERAARVAPHARVIVLLRDPAERAWSHYRHEVAAGRESLSFLDAIRAEPERLAGAEDAVRTGSSADLAEAHRRHSYVARGRYAEQLARWFAVFPREQILVLRAEDLFHEPDRVWAGVQDFLGLPYAVHHDFAAHNAQPPAEMPAAARDELAGLFEGPNRDLAALLGTDYWGDSR